MGLLQDILSVALDVIGNQFDQMAQTGRTKIDDYKKEASDRGYSFSKEQEEKIKNAEKLIHNCEVYGDTFDKMSDHVENAKNFYQGYTNVKKDIRRAHTGKNGIDNTYVNYEKQKNQKRTQQKAGDDFQERLDSGYYDMKPYVVEYSNQKETSQTKDDFQSKLDSGYYDIENWDREVN